MSKTEAMFVSCTGSLLVNNKKVNIPSYKLKKSDTIQVKRTSVSLVKERISSQIETKIVLRENLIQAPSYLEVNYKLMKGFLEMMWGLKSSNLKLSPGLKI